MENKKNESHIGEISLGSRRLSQLEPSEQYVALIDVLGWNRYIRSDFKQAVEIYDLILDFCDLIKAQPGVASIRVFSDSILLVSPEFVPVATAANTLLYAALLQDCLLRGGIARGKHIELGGQAELYIVSEGLVHAATLEKDVKKPCIVIDPKIVPSIPPATLRTVNPFLRKLLFYDGLWIINPFNIMWGTSAATRVTQLKERYPEHSDKYDWLLGLCPKWFGHLRQK